MIDYKKLYDALVTIQNTCNVMQDGKGCKYCPLSAGKENNVCCVSDLNPHNWELVDPGIVKLMR